MLPLLAFAVIDAPKGGAPVATTPPTSKELHDWSTGFADLQARLAAAEAQLEAAETTVATARQAVTDVRTVLALFQMGAENWSKAVKP